MTIGLAMIVRNEAAIIERCLASAAPLIDHWTIVDTGSTDTTKRLIAETLNGIPGQLIDAEWTGFADGLNGALAAARDTADWLLRLDADMTAEAHPGLRDWLADDPDPATDAWMVEIADGTLAYQLPMLVRGGQEWTYRGATHEWLDLAGRNRRPLLGLTLHHHADGINRDGKFERDLELLQPGFDAGDPRDTFYFAQTLRDLGRVEEAAAAYERRAAMDGTWEEERWYAAYQVAALCGDLDGLLAVHRERPWRHEPLTAASRLVAGRGADGDMLFLEKLDG